MSVKFMNWKTRIRKSSLFTMIFVLDSGIVHSYVKLRDEYAIE